MAAYLTKDQFKVRSIIPSGEVDAIETAESGFVAARLGQNQAWIEARLTKRYAVPFDSTSVPEIVLSWLVALTTLDVYMKRGFSPGSQQDAIIQKASDDARADVKEAADSNVGLFDLPLRQSSVSSSGVSKGGPFGYSEQSPYVAFDEQVSTARDEDYAGTGS